MGPEFVTVAAAADIPEGKMALFSVGDLWVAVANVEGTFYAFDDNCSHQKCSLSEGHLDGTTVICPCHGGSFDITNGAVLSPPALRGVPTYPVRVAGDTIQIAPS